jgi:PhoPQ-activated pathogenicity-related protein
MNGWELVQTDPGGTCIGQGLTNSGGQGGMRRRSAASWADDVVDAQAWPDGTPVQVWAVVKAEPQPGEWLLLTTAKASDWRPGDVVEPAFWTHSVGVIKP